jgi:hypothetical protein
MGYGSYGKSFYKNKEYKVAIVANINSKTIRHITGIPNHVRSWRKDIYHQIGGHHIDLHVADDYELFIRTFLKTKIAKIDVFTYIQYFERNYTNTQFNKNGDIQQLTAYISEHYNQKIHDRFMELGIDDFAWNDGVFDSEMQKPVIEPYANIVIPKKLLKNNLIKMTDKKDLYGYSRVYDIPSTLEYKKTEHYSNLIKWLVKLTNCQSYLELGVESGSNIREIENFVNLCVGVDINELNTEKNNIEFFQMPTDDFFKNNQRKFDIIFIDADHTFEQVKKDFDNSLMILNKYGVIILHDTDPMIEELLEPHYCNDSYKIIDYISSKKTLNIVTLPIQETGMTIVTRKKDRRINNFIKTNK